MKKLFLAACSALFLMVLVAAVAVAAAFYWYQRAGSLPQQTVVLIEPKTSFKRIAEQLEQAGVVGNALLYRAVTIAKGQHSGFKAGEYAFEARISPQQVTDMIVSGRSINHSVTIPEGKNSAEIVGILQSDDRLIGEINLPIEEGSLLPDTHQIHRGDARQSVVDRMRKAQEKAMVELWPLRAEGLPFATMAEALTLASIVEKETGIAEERPMVAGVFINRLRMGMPLQSDPTVVYAIERAKGPMSRPLTRQDWKFDSPYNTYVHAGLPPAPICHPGLAAMKAVLNPPSHDYVYFVATGRGGHHFARNLAEHNQNISRYKAALRSAE